jgi:pimeloyl-ACP methyl ester carboxylesterase
MQDPRLPEHFGGTGSALLLVHANGFPPGVYKSFLRALSARHSVWTVRLRPLWEPQGHMKSGRWQRMAEDIGHALSFMQDLSLGPVTLVGHSLGGTCSLMLTIRRRDLVHRLVLIEPALVALPTIISTRLIPWALLKRTGLIGSTLHRPEHFDSHQSAFDFHRHKEVFRGLSDDALHDYIEHAYIPTQDRRVRLVFPRHWEAMIYASAPYARPLLTRLRVPSLIIHAENSNMYSRQEVKVWGHLPNIRVIHMSGVGHLAPMEDPARTARLID